MHDVKSLTCELKKDDILYFLHIPKTAGTTLSTILDQHFDLDSICPEQDWNQILKNTKMDFSKYKLIRGHFGYGIHKVLPKKPVYITMLRDPIERTISFYHHLMIDRSINRWADELLTDTKDLLDLFNDPKKKLVFTNNQTHYIALDHDVLSIVRIDSKEEDFIYEGIPEFISPDTPNEKLLDIVKNHISEFKFFGLTERFEESLMLLCYTFSWRPIHNISKEMVLPGRPSRDSFSKETIDSIKKQTKLDAELYHYGKQLFESRFSQMVKELKEKYYEPRFDSVPFKQMMYELLEKNYNECFGQSNTLVSSIDFNFKQALNGSGWYSREFLPDGNAFRWTGPETISTIDFPLSRNSDLVIQFCIVMCLVPDILESLRLKINETPINIRILEQDKGKTIFEGMIPKSALDSERNFTRVTFEVNRTTSSKSTNPDSPDTRMLGLAFEWIKIT